MRRRAAGRPRAHDPEETRRELLRAAAAAFSEAGFFGASTRDIARRAGLNVATLHYHFGGKEGLHTAVLDEISRGELPVPAARGSAAARLSRLVEALWDFTRARPALARLALLARLVPAGAAWADPRAALLESEAGRLGAPEPAQAAAAILAFLDAAAVTAGDAARPSVAAAALSLAGLRRPPR